MSEFEGFGDESMYTPEEIELLRSKVKHGSDVDPIPKIPDAPDISPAPKKKGGVPGTLKNSIANLSELRPDEVPIVGKHFVVWGSVYLSDIRPRPVKKAVKMTEDEHAIREVEHTKVLLSYGLKNPKEWTDPSTRKPLMDSERDQPGAVQWDRIDRTEHYARWRYRGYVCGEVVSL